MEIGRVLFFAGYHYRALIDRIYTQSFERVLKSGICLIDILEKAISVLQVIFAYLTLF